MTHATQPTPPAAASARTRALVGTALRVTYPYLLGGGSGYLALTVVSRDLSLMCAGALLVLYGAGLGHMTLDAGGKGTFLRHESSTVQSAARCNVDHPDIAPSPHLCDAVPAFLRIWMPKDSFPPASSVMWPSPYGAALSKALQGQGQTGGANGA